MTNISRSPFLTVAVAQYTVIPLRATVSVMDCAHSDRTLAPRPATVRKAIQWKLERSVQVVDPTRYFCSAIGSLSFEALCGESAIRRTSYSNPRWFRIASSRQVHSLPSLFGIQIYPLGLYNQGFSPVFSRILFSFVMSSPTDSVLDTIVAAAESLSMSAGSSPPYAGYRPLAFREDLDTWWGGYYD